jgi:hypothetical protein
MKKTQMRKIRQGAMISTATSMRVVVPSTTYLMVVITAHALPVATVGAVIVLGLGRQLLRIMGTLSLTLQVGATSNSLLIEMMRAGSAAGLHHRCLATRARIHQQCSLPPTPARHRLERQSWPRQLALKWSHALLQDYFPSQNGTAS